MAKTTAPEPSPGLEEMLRILRARLPSLREAVSHILADIEPGGPPS